VPKDQGTWVHRDGGGNPDTLLLAESRCDSEAAGPGPPRPAPGDLHASSNELLGTRPLVVGMVISFLLGVGVRRGVPVRRGGLGANPFFLLVVFAISSLVGGLNMLPGGIGAVEVPASPCGSAC
jgi:hypothetical protein